MGIISSVNLAVSSVYDMQQAMNADIDTSSLNYAREQLNQATIAAQELQQAMDNVDSIPAQKTSVPEPMQQPIQWQTDTMPVFNGSGMDRFQQEIQSTRNMLDNLNEQQMQINVTASSLDILPDNAVQDITGLRDRIHGIVLAIQEIENNPVEMGIDTANSELEQLRSQLSQALAEQENLNQAMQNMDISAANNSYLRLSQTISNTERYIRGNTSEQEKLNQTARDLQTPISAAAAGFKGWQKAIIVANQTLGLVKNTISRLGVTDTSGAFDRIDTMNRFQKTTSIMTGDANMAKAALAQLNDTVRGTAYGLDVASKAAQGFLTRGMGLGSATDQVRIWADAVSFYGEGTNEQLESVVDAIGKMYSKGTVEADQLDRLFDAGIGAAEIYANAVGESVGSVKEDLSDGEISAAQFINTVSQALDNGVSNGAAKDAGGTWATTFANMRAAITRGWTEVINNLDAALAAHNLPSSMEMVTMFGQTVESVLNNVGNSMDWIVGAAVNIGDAMSSAGSFISDNWGTIAPIIGAVIAAMLTYNGVLLACNVIQGVKNTLETIHAARLAMTTIAEGAETTATFAATAAQYGFNAALLACPLTWIVLAIIALIAVVIVLSNHFSGAGHTAQSAFGAICGAVNVAIQFFKNLGLSVANIALGIWGAIKALANNIYVAFHNSICSVQVAFYTLLLTSLAVIARICKELNKLPFVEFDYSGIMNAADHYAAKITEANNSKMDYSGVSDAFNDGIKTFDTFQKGWVDNAYKEGATFGDGITSKVKEMFTFKAKEKDKDKDKDYRSALDKSKNLAETAANTSNTAKNTAKAANSLAITTEDLKYLRDMAEQEVINRFTTAKITVNMTNHNNVNNDMDLDGITEHLRVKIEEQMNAAAEGVH